MNSKFNHDKCKHRQFPRKRNNSTRRTINRSAEVFRYAMEKKKIVNNPEDDDGNKIHMSIGNLSGMFHPSCVKHGNVPPTVDWSISHNHLDINNNIQTDWAMRGLTIYVGNKWIIHGVFITLIANGHIKLSTWRRKKKKINLCKGIRNGFNPSP